MRKKTSSKKCTKEKTQREEFAQNATGRGRKQRQLND
jgi:hypothetical protein